MGGFAGGLGGVGAIIAGTAVVRMIPDFTGFGNKVSNEMQGFSKRASAIGGTLTKAVTLPILGIGVAAVKAFGEAQRVAAQTEAVIKSTGGAAKVTTGDIAELAHTLSQKTAVDDEAIQSGSNLLLTFTNIRNEAGAGNDIFNQTTRAMLDMSQAMGQDTKTSAIQLGKALNDPVKGVTALRRVGVAFNETQIETIKSLVAGGKTLDAQKLILAELTKEFGGSAEAFAQTTEGKMQKAMNDLGNAGESLGAILQPVITAVAGGLSRIAEAFQSLSPGAQKVVAVVLAVVAAVGPLLLITAKLVTAFGVVKDAIIGVQIASAPMILLWVAIGLAVAALVFVIVKNWDTIKKFLLAVWNGIKTAALAVFNALKTYFTTVFNIYKTVILGVWNVIKATLSAIWNGIRAAATAVWGGLKAAFSAYVNAYKTVILGAFNLIKNTLSAIWNGIVGAVRTAWNTITSIIRGAIDAVMAPINALKSAVSWLLPGSPVPFVVGLEKSAKALRALGAEARRINLPSFAAPALGAARAQVSRRGERETGTSVREGDRTYQLNVSSRESVGSIRGDFRMMEAMAR